MFYLKECMFINWVVNKLTNISSNEINADYKDSLIQPRSLVMKIRKFIFVKL